MLLNHKISNKTVHHAAVPHTRYHDHTVLPRTRAVPEFDLGEAFHDIDREFGGPGFFSGREFVNEELRPQRRGGHPRKKAIRGVVLFFSSIELC